MNVLSGIHCVRKDYEQNLKWATKGAEAGLPLSMFNLGAGAYTRSLFGST